ncbi:hypothetical protein [Paenibacillus sp. 453mf]|uniref:hypothetical protein n=1 Tax=Paenibacillus sp. 453mf TaxID=1761874 RepID=UPI0008ED17F3|nr:hypothetical protein [Paenibacillus sp. 453mf]SFS56883.1 hypothetical protein SAMN04488601_1011831 [Paenibacillus sp. 453mf]
MNIINALIEVARRINQKDIPYVIGGSTATAINGCTSIKPNDIDVILQNPGDVEKVVFIFEDFLSESQASEITNVADWFSTKSRAVIDFVDPFNNTWTFARVLINDIKWKLQIYVQLLILNMSQKQVYGRVVQLFGHTSSKSFLRARLFQYYLWKFNWKRIE